MTRVLGLDIGSKSIGWALLDFNAKKIVATGVRVFPEGVSRTPQGTEESKNAKRRGARSTRRQIARKARRRKRLASILMEAGLYPATREERQALHLTDPYVLREKGIIQQLSLYEFGRVLLHLCKRRGFKSNSKADRAKEKENSEMLKEISLLEQMIQEAKCDTLGEFLAKSRKNVPLEKIRGKHTRRSMFENEFEILWKYQSTHHSQLSPELKNAIHQAIFFQRKIKTNKKSIGRCSLELTLPRASLKDRAAQLARVYQEITNLRLIEADGEIRQLKDPERDNLFSYLAGAKERTFDQIRKHMKWINCEFNLAAGGREKLLGVPVDKEMESKKLFGKNWNKKSEEEKTKIVRQIILFCSRDEKEPEIEIAKEKAFETKAIEDWGLPPENIENLMSFDPGSGRAAFCFKALDKLLPFLKKGYPMMSEDEKPSAFSLAEYLRPDQKTPNQCNSLPAPTDEITNPIVKQALHEVRLLVNAVIREYGLPEEIHVELAREAKGNKERREEIILNQRKNEKERNEAKSRVEENGLIPGRGSIEFYRLWKDQDGECIYSGKPISLKQLLGGEVNVDHVWPYSRCLDDSLSNKVVCLRDENNAKKNMTPREWLEKNDPQKWEAVLQRVRKLPYPGRIRKLERFLAVDVKLDDFINRELNDTAYISRQVANFIRCLGTRVVCVRGGITAELRHQWGLNSILNPNKVEKKTREDHRHHGVDAMVIAATSQSSLQALSSRKKDSIINPPWENFRAQAEEIILKIFVSHKPRRRVRGQLHEETIYGPTQKKISTATSRPWAKGWCEVPNTFCCRKKLGELTMKMISDIRDGKVKELILARLLSHGVDLENDTKIPPSIWTEPLVLQKSAGTKGSIIKKVRILRKEKSIVPLRSSPYQVFVKPGNTHHIEIFEKKTESGKVKRIMQSVTMLEAYRRKTTKEPIVQRSILDDPAAKFIMSLCPGDMILLIDKGKELLCRYSTSASTEMKIKFVQHTDARPSSMAGIINKNANTLTGRKVTVDILGQLRFAGD